LGALKALAAVRVGASQAYVFPFPQLADGVPAQWGYRAMSERIESPEATDAATTPLMAQYLAMKRQHPDALLFYRMGDFYELFFADAEKAAAALSIVLTTRGTHLGEPIKMCGVPIHAAEGYLNRLIRKGFKVAVCEQVEDPAEARKRGSKSVVRRDVVRVVTPGTLTEDGLLDAASHNYLCALADAAGTLGLAWVDISTGQFRCQAIERKALPAALARLDPTEILLPDRLLLQSDLYELFQEWKSALSPLPNARFDSENARLRLQSFHKVAALDAFGAFTRSELAAAGGILDYVELTQQGKMPRLTQLARIGAGAILEIDAATRRNLELSRTAGWRAAGQPALDHRPQRDRRRRAPAGRLALGAADRHRRHRRAPRRHRISDQRSAGARGCARGPEARAGP
jgi:DNA mismatch repair protein MutS